MNILVRLVLNRKCLEIISRFCATLSAIGCPLAVAAHVARRVALTVACCRAIMCHSVYIYMYTCTYTYVYIYIYIYNIQKCICINLYLSIHVIYTHLYIYIYKCIYTCIYIHPQQDQIPYVQKRIFVCGDQTDIVQYHYITYKKKRSFTFVTSRIA